MNHWKTISERFADLRRQLHLRVVLVHHAPDGPPFLFPPAGADGGFIAYRTRDLRQTTYITARHAPPGWAGQLDDVASAAAGLPPVAGEACERWTSPAGAWWSHVFGVAQRGDNPLLRSRLFAWTVAPGDVVLSREIGADAEPATWWSELDDALWACGVVADAMARDVVPAMRELVAVADLRRVWPQTAGLNPVRGDSSKLTRWLREKCVVFKIGGQNYVRIDDALGFWPQRSRTYEAICTAFSVDDDQL